MTVLLLCDRQTETQGAALLEAVRLKLEQAGHQLAVTMLNHEALKPCMGCFGCWVKTPGLCVITSDDANAIARREIRSDAVVLLSKITYGGFSADIKAMLDRSIGNVMPYFEVRHGEMHHQARYDHFPIYITLGYGSATAEEQRVFKALAERNALNMHAPKHLGITVTQDEQIEQATQAILNALEGR